MMHLVQISRELVECCPQSARESVQTGPQTTGQAAQEKEDEVNLLTTSNLWPLASDPVHLQTVREGAEREPVGAAEEPQQGGLHRGLPPGCDHTIFIENYVRKEKENVECLGVIWKCGWYSKLDNWDQFLSGGAWWAAWHSLLPGLYREEPWQDVLLGLISTHTK